MNQVVNQFRRIFSDNGRSDKDFTEQETRLREAQRQLVDAAALLHRAAETLSDLIKTRSI